MQKAKRHARKHRLMCPEYDGQQLDSFQEGCKYFRRIQKIVKFSMSNENFCFFLCHNKTATALNLMTPKLQGSRTSCFRWDRVYRNGKESAKTARDHQFQVLGSRRVKLLFTGRLMVCFPRSLTRSLFLLLCQRLPYNCFADAAWLGPGHELSLTSGEDLAWSHSESHLPAKKQRR